MIKMLLTALHLNLLALLALAVPQPASAQDLDLAAKPPMG